MCTICFWLTFSSSCWVLIKNDLPVGWFLCDSWCPKGARHVWGRPVCLGLNAGVSVTRLAPSRCFLFFALTRSFTPFVCFFLETPAMQVIIP